MGKHINRFLIDHAWRVSSARVGDDGVGGADMVGHRLQTGGSNWLGQTNLAAGQVVCLIGPVDSGKLCCWWLCSVTHKKWLGAGKKSANRSHTVFFKKGKALVPLHLWGWQTGGSRARDGWRE